jgi:hypothetical protein
MGLTCYARVVLPFSLELLRAICVVYNNTIEISVDLLAEIGKFSLHIYPKLANYRSRLPQPHP